MSVKLNYKDLYQKEKTFYEQDFSPLTPIFEMIRTALSNGSPIKISNKSEVNKLIDYNKKDYIYITLYQDYVPYIAFGTSKPDLESALNVCVYNLRKNPRFQEFDFKNPNKIRILIEWITNKEKIDISKMHFSTTFDRNRLEPGINGLCIHKSNWYNWLPSTTIARNSYNLIPIILWAFQKLGLEIPENIKLGEAKNILKAVKGAEYFSTTSHCILSVNDKIVPLYRGDILYKNFSYPKLKQIMLSGVDWLLKYFDNDSGKFLYYYNHLKDNNVDHEHPARKEPDLYYNDLRHSGCVILLLNAYEITKEQHYLDYAKKALMWSIKNTIKEYVDDNGDIHYWAFYNKKGKLGGSGILLCAFMKYRIISNDKTFDKYIEGLVRHLLSRMTEDGEFLGYYVHPRFNDGNPIINPTIEEKRELFSQYYPGEALLGMALFINHYPAKKKFLKDVIEKSKTAMHWIIHERPKYYADLFEALPADSWLMQAIEEFAKCKEPFLEKEAIEFVFKDADIMSTQMYKNGETPYLDLEGVMYYSYGGYYYIDGARSEGLVAAYYLAKILGKDTLAKKYLKACKLSAKAQYKLYNTEINTYTNMNPHKSFGAIKFISKGREFVRADAFQHTGCFFARLYLTK